MSNVGEGELELVRDAERWTLNGRCDLESDGEVDLLEERIVNGC